MITYQVFDCCGSDILNPRLYFPNDPDTRAKGLWASMPYSRLICKRKRTMTWWEEQQLLSQWKTSRRTLKSWHQRTSKKLLIVHRWCHWSPAMQVWDTMNLCLCIGNHSAIHWWKTFYEDHDLVLQQVMKRWAALQAPQVLSSKFHKGLQEKLSDLASSAQQSVANALGGISEAILPAKDSTADPEVKDFR